MPRPTHIDKPILTLDDLPKAGLIFWSDFLSTRDDPRLIRFSQATWRRMADSGKGPPGVKLFGRITAHAEHVRAVYLGRDWRKVRTSADLMEDAA